MNLTIMKRLGVVLIIVMVSGCTGSSGIRAKSYAKDRQRVDQAMEGGNFGYLHGDPVAEDRSDFKKTRKIYVLEITKDVEDVEDGEGEIKIDPVSGRSVSSSGKKSTSASQRPLPDWAKPIDIPEIKGGPAAKRKRTSKTKAASVKYTIQKDDTLQEISKKFYGSYREWTQIYEANRDVITDPNRIKPGITIHIPPASE